MIKEFVHLHVHTEYSLLDGAIRTKALAKKVAEEFQVKSVAMTDHGVMYGAVEFYENCIAQGVKPILGCETYVAPDGIDSRENKKSNHLLLLAENETGWHNLIKLISIANTQGFYYKPRIDHDLLREYHGGIIASSACLAGEIPQFILHEDMKAAEERAAEYRDIMGKGNFFLEIMPNSLPEQKIVNEAIVDISRRTNIPVIATGDAHYLNSGDYEWHKILLKVNTHADANDDAFGFSANDFYLKSAAEFDSVFGDWIPEALSNTVAISERCNVKLIPDKKDYLLPKLKLEEGMTADEDLRKKAHEGLRERFSSMGRGEVTEKYLTRLEYELGIIIQMGFSAYFLIVSGIIQAAKSRNIPIGPGRGSAAGSLVAWSLKITELDPLKYDLLFERFLNPERISMPDIDTDVSDKGRDELLKYISQHYGSDHVAQIITFGRMKGRQSVKDVGRALGMEYSVIDNAAKLIPATAKNIESALEESSEFKERYINDPTLRNIVDKAKNIEGLARHTSQHAAGVVITPVPITDIVPVKRLGTDKDSTDQIVTQFTMEPVEKLGLVKMDFLGLSTLSIIQEALQNIANNGKPVPNLNEVNDLMNDEKTFKLLQDADTMGVFQFESDGIRAMLRKLKVDRFEDLVAALAMYRPGPLDSGMVDQYIDCKHGRKKPAYPHDLLEPVLKETFGVILYQEQVMQCASVLAGYTLGEADILRRAMGKKKFEVMQEQRAKFLKGAADKNINSETAAKIFDNIEKFAGYGFNKSHSAAYALISYDTAWLKANYKCEFMAAYLSSQMKAKKEVLGHYVLEVRRSGIKVLPPDINSSMEDFTAVGDVIRFGLGAVSRMGHNPVAMIIKERSDNGNFKSLWDFMKRVDLSVINKSAIENLIKAGAFDELLSNRARLIAAIPDYIKAIQNTGGKKKNPNQLDIFAMLEGDETIASEPDMPEVLEYEDRERLEYEKEVTGLYISGHPYEEHQDKLKDYVNCTIADLANWKGNSIMPRFGGIISALKEKNTKKGDAMCNLQIDDAENSVSVVIFPDKWKKLKGSLNVNAACVIEGKLDDRGQIILENIILSENLESSGQKYINIVMNLTGNNNINLLELMRKFIGVIAGCKGSSKIILEVRNEDESCTICFKDNPVEPEKFQQKLHEEMPAVSRMFEFKFEIPAA